MKVGKKLLSTLLAILMIVSSVSVCFGVLGADSSIESLMRQIELNHASLIDLIQAAEKDTATEEDVKKVPASSGSGYWEVERDTSVSSWHWVAYAYAQAANYVAESKDTLYGIYEGILAKIEEEIDKNSSGRMPLARYEEILREFTFGESTNL